MQLLEVPFPHLGPGTVLVRTHFSAISAGTEGKTVNDARLGYIGKARARKEEVKKVVKAVRTFGLKDTYNMVMNKLEAPSALGYSLAGTVIAIADDVRGFNVGDRVACGGASAVHAEVVAVPENLCAKVPEGVALDQASMTTIAAIALQGIRLADVQVGGNAVVIGLGLIGKITMMLLRSAGITPVGVDVDARQVERTRDLGFDLVFERGAAALEDQISDFTGGHGTDTVIITAGTSSLDPVNFAGQISRPKGIVVIVGNAPTGFDRKAFYKKELELRMSASYGPGRYNANYEEKGMDYPIGYVRWTENRNMQAVLALLQSKSLNFAPLISHQFKFEQAKEAYDMILAKTEYFAGIVLAYQVDREISTSFEATTSASEPVSEVAVSFIGAGSFAQNFLLPNIKDLATLQTVFTARPNNARNMVDKYGFRRAVSSAEEVVSDPSCNTVVIATRHNTHAEYVLAALRNNKHVFVEKPLCLHLSELEAIAEAKKSSSAQVMVGFNRRFSPATEMLKQGLTGQRPLSLNYQINAGKLPADHWVHDPEVGGGRILGEACHFIDLAIYLTGSRVVGVQAAALGTEPGLGDSAIILLKMQNGSVANINYLSNGHSGMPKERIEIQQDGQFWQLIDFVKLYQNSLSKPLKSWPKAQKGYAEELKAFTDSIRDGKPCPVPFSDTYHSMEVTFEVLRQMRMSLGDESADGQ